MYRLRLCVQVGCITPRREESVVRGRQGVPSRPIYNPKAGPAIWLCPAAILMRFEVFILHCTGLLSIFAGCDMKVGREAGLKGRKTRDAAHRDIRYYGRE